MPVTEKNLTRCVVPCGEAAWSDWPHNQRERMQLPKICYFSLSPGRDDRQVGHVMKERDMLEKEPHTHIIPNLGGTGLTVYSGGGGEP